MASQSESECWLRGVALKPKSLYEIIVVDDGRFCKEVTKKVT
jgi:hypothetical protein